MTPPCDTGYPGYVLLTIAVCSYLFGAVGWYKEGKEDEKIYWYNHLRKKTDDQQVQEHK